MKALVTGAAGFCGSTLATALTDRGAEVTGLDCFTDYYAREVKEGNLEDLRRRPNFQFVEGPLQDVDLDPLLDGVTHVFHLAAQAGVRGSWGDQFRSYTSHNVDA
jgi:nucleoside-diphosphate-sugar epimerase